MMDASIHRRSGAAIENRPNEAERSDETGPPRRPHFLKNGRAPAARPGDMAHASRRAP